MNLNQTMLPQRPPRLIRLEAEQPLSYVLAADICTLGRSPICHVPLPQAIVSRLHARIERSGAHYLLSDIGSANGTFVNGRPLCAPHRLIDGDLIGLGSAIPVFRFEA
jgi:pSer/pThr/pTyr-binding forkhead associated (FHA) protein